MIAQTIFYLVFSVAAIVIGALLAIATYYLVQIARKLELLTQRISDTTDDVRLKIQDTVDRIADLPLLPFIMSFLKRRRKIAAEEPEDEE